VIVDLLKRPDGLLEPVGDCLRKVPAGSLVKANLTRPNHQGLHKKLLATMRFAWDNLPEGHRFSSYDEFRRAMLIQAGEVEYLPLMDGTFAVQAKSLKWSAMDGMERERVLDKLCVVIMDKILEYETNPEELERLIREHGARMGVIW